jgi:high-affinity iron transporter
MWQGFTIALREGIEAFLIVALTLSYLQRTGRGSLAKAVYAAIAVSVVTCGAAGFLFSKAANQPLWEGVLALVAAALVGSLLVYMKRVSARLKSDIENRLEASAQAATTSGAFWGVFAFALLMITREGMETALLIATALFQMKSSAVMLGLGVGLACAAAIGLLWTRIGRDVPLKTLLNVSAVFLGIFLVQLVLYGIHELSEARLFRRLRRSTTRPRSWGRTERSATCSRTRWRSSHGVAARPVVEAPPRQHRRREAAPRGRGVARYRSIAVPERRGDEDRRSGVVEAPRRVDRAREVSARGRPTCLCNPRSSDNSRSGRCSSDTSVSWV